MKIALGQINTIVGDLPGNVDRCVAVVRQAQSSAADLVLLPEMAVTGYPPRDILLDTSFTASAVEATQDLARRTQDGPPVLVGSIAPSGRQAPAGHPGLLNCAMLLHQGHVQIAAEKRLLPGYDVFYEPRWFLPGQALPPLSIKGTEVGVLLCEDLWDEAYAQHPPADLIAAGADLLICLSAGPYRRGIQSQRLYHAHRTACPVIHLNMVGAADELIFDGRSFITDGQGHVTAQLAGFAEDFRLIDTDELTPSPQDEHPDPSAELYRALVLGIRDFVHKNGISHAYLGLSGGIDSAVVACLAAEALGPEQVTALAIPSRYTDPRSTNFASELAGTLGIGLTLHPLDDLHRAAEASLADLLDSGTTAENIQARLRGMILMSYVNHYGGLLLNTSNKTELSLGYATIYGDMAGTLAPIGDLTKPEVVSLARWINAEITPIPRFILVRLPTAELRPDQVDPFNYAEVGPAMESLVRANRSNPALRRSEHKRWQMGVILRVSPKAFGSGRLIPITRR